jgi:hypothetical protein
MARIAATRRDLFGGAAALLGVAGPTGMAAGSGAHPDAELVTACARFERAEAEWRRLSELESDIEDNERHLDSPSAALMAAKAAFEAFCDGEYHPAMDAVLDAPDPKTPEGLRAVAQAVWAFCQPDVPGEHGMRGLMWPIVCIVAGRPQVTAETPRGMLGRMA